MDHQQMLARYKAFSLRVIRLVEALPKKQTARILGDQLLRSGTSVSANYRAARRGRSKAEFIAKLGIVEEEADESVHWMELIVETGLLPAERVTPLIDESNQIVAMTVTSIRTARRSRNAQRDQ